jgi:hypothetical protein
LFFFIRGISSEEEHGMKIEDWLENSISDRATDAGPRIFVPKLTDGNAVG